MSHDRQNLHNFHFIRIAPRLTLPNLLKRTNNLISRTNQPEPTVFKSMIQTSAFMENKI